MNRISLRSLLCAAGFVLLALLPRAIRSLMRQSHPAQEKVRNDELLKYHTATNPLAHLTKPENTIEMAPRLFFIPSKQSTIRIAEGIVGEIILTGPNSMIDKLEIRHFTLSPVTAGHFTFKFTKTQDGTWQQQRVRSQPAPVEITRVDQKIVVRFRWQPSPTEDQSTFLAAKRGVDVTLTGLLDGKETRLVKRGIPVNQPEKTNVSASSSRN